MPEALDISADTVREHLLTRARAFREAHKTSFSAIGDAAIKDSKFLANVEKGANFTLNTYQRVIDWLDAAEREAA